MEKDGFERVERWADRIQLFALAIVLVIISAAVWLATFFALSPFIADLVVQSLLATSVSLALAGTILIWRHRMLIGYSLVFLCSGSAFISLILLWNTTQTTALCIHAELIVILLLLDSMRKRLDTVARLWKTASFIFGIVIVLSAPFTALLILSSLAIAVNETLSLCFLITSVYLIIAQFELKNPKIGSLNIPLLSLIFGIQALNWLPTAIASDIQFIATAFVIGMGVGLLIISQAAKRMQNWLIQRHKIDDYHKTHSDSEEPPSEAASSDEPEPTTASIQAEWIISPEAANALSACATVEISLGIPSQFLWMASTTEWGNSPDFLPMMGPLAFIFALLVLAPSPVFLRLAERIRRETEAIAVRAIGFLVVLLAALTSFLWTAHFLWPIFLSVASFVILFLVGITGLFRSVRRLWRNLWLSIVGSLRRIKVWIMEHVVLAGILCDTALSLLVLIIFYRTLIALPEPLLSIGISFAFPFTVMATIGVFVLKRLPRRNLLLALGFTSILILLGGTSFWNLHFILGIDLLHSLLLSSLWFYGVVVLQLADIRRIYLAPLYLVSALSAFYLIWTTSIFPEELRISMLISASQFIGIPMLYKEYRLAGTAIFNALRLAGQRIHAGLVYLTSLIIKFILYSSAVILILLLVVLNLLVLAPYLQYDWLLIFSWSTFLFLIFYLPIAGTREDSPSFLKPFGATVIAATSGLLLFLYLPQFDILTRLLAFVSIFFFIMSITSNLFPDHAKFAFYAGLWIGLLSFMALQAVYFSRAYVMWPADYLTGILVFGVGILVLKMIDTVSRHVDVLYLILVLPSSTLLTYFLTFDYLLCVIILAIVPIPVAYRQYTKALIIIGSAIVYGLQIIAVYFAIYIVFASAILSAVLSGFAALYWLPIIFTYHANPTLLQAVSFAVLVLALWLPALRLRRSDYHSILSAVTASLCILLGFDIVLALQFTDAFFSILLLIVISSFMLVLTVPLIDVPLLRTLAIALFLCSSILLAIYIVPGDAVSKVLLSAFTIFLVTNFSVPSHVRKDALVLLGTSTIAAFVFWNFYLFSSDVPISVLGFFWIDALFARFAIPETKSSAWFLFSASSAILLALLLSFLYPASLLISCLAFIEILRIDSRFAFTGMYSRNALGLSRAILLGGITYFSLSQLLPSIGIAFTLESLLVLSLLVGSVALYGSVFTSLNAITKYLFSLMISIEVSLLLFIFVFTMIQQPLLVSVYVSLFPVIPFFLFQAISGSYPRSSWYAFVLLAAVAAGFTWMLVAGVTASILLILTTTAFILSAGYLTTPSGLESRRLAVAFTAASFLVMLESIWLWGSIAIFQFAQMVTLVGACIIPLSTILLPLLGILEWKDFIWIWATASLVVSVPSSCMLTGWDFFANTLPPSFLLTAGAVLSVYSLLAVPVIAFAEAKMQRLRGERIFYLPWLPSVLGWGLLGAEIGFSFFSTLELALSFALLGSSLALFFLYAFLPDKSTSVFAVSLVSLAGALGVLVWFFGLPIVETPVLITIVVLVIYAVSLPLTLAATIAALTWVSIQFERLLDAFVEILNGIAAAIRRNIVTFALVLPLFLSGLVVWLLTYVEISPLLLGYSIRPAAFLFSAFFLAIGACYAVEALALDEVASRRLQYPALGALAIGANGVVLASSLPESTEFILLIGNILLMSGTISLACLGLLSYAFKKSRLGRGLLALLGVSAFLYVLTTLYWLSGTPLFYSLWPALALFLMIEIPIFRTQVRILLSHLADLGRLFAAFMRRLGSLIADIFRRFGYYTWTFFSFLFVGIIGVLSRPFFSELIGAPSTGVFHEVPNFSIPLMILGLLSLLLAIVRRRVRSAFGVFSGMLSIAGLGISVVTLLFDLGHAYLSVFVSILGICSSGLLVKGELSLDSKWTPMIWLPIPVSLSAVLFYFVGFQHVTFDGLLTSVLVSVFPSTTLFLLSTYINLLDERYREFIWIALGLQSGATVYFLSYLAVTPSFSQMAGLYLGIMAATLVSSPIIFQKVRQLFYAFLFFSVTGFAYTSVLGSPVQSMFLAVAALLLFVSRYVKEMEAEHPQLVYLRLVILLALICCIVIFVILSGLAFVFV